jgi:hypothetical protein
MGGQTTASARARTNGSARLRPNRVGHATTGLCTAALLACGCAPKDYLLGLGGSAGSSTGTAGAQRGGGASAGSTGATVASAGGNAGNAGGSSVPVSAGAGGTAGNAGTGAFGPFGEPQLVSELSVLDVDDDDPALTPDLLELFFASSRPGGLGGADVWRSTRAAPSEPWEPPTAVVELNTEAIETSVGLARDGLVIWISTDRPGGLGGFDIWSAARPSRDDPWSDPVPVPELNSPYDELARGTDRSGRHLYIASKRDTEGGDFDLFVSSRTDLSAAWGTLEPITELNTPESDADPFLGADDLAIFFTSDRAGTAGDDLYTAVRPTAAGLFAAAAPMAELNGPGRDSDPWVSDDLRYIMFASNREDRGLDLYEAWR